MVFSKLEFAASYDDIGIKSAGHWGTVKVETLWRGDTARLESVSVTTECLVECLSPVDSGVL